ncbi:MAG: hypothetical protein U1F06_02090 [Steroidobacteraceae bacterium]
MLQRWARCCWSSFVAVAGVTIAVLGVRSSAAGAIGLTTEVAALVTFLLGVSLSGAGEPLLAGGAAIAVAVLLAAKPTLRRFARAQRAGDRGGARAGVISRNRPAVAAAHGLRPAAGKPARDLAGGGGRSAPSFAASARDAPPGQVARKACCRWRCSAARVPRLCHGGDARVRHAERFKRRARRSAAIAAILAFSSAAGAGAPSPTSRARCCSARAAGGAGHGAGEPGAGVLARATGVLAAAPAPELSAGPRQSLQPAGRPLSFGLLYALVLLAVPPRAWAARQRRHLRRGRGSALLDVAR